MTIWLYLHFPDLYLHSCYQTEQKPCVVLRQQSNQYYVHQCNHAADRIGIKADMPLASALCLDAELKTVLLDSHKEQQLLQQKALWAYQFSAQVGLDSPQGLWLEASSMQSLFGGFNALCRHIQQQAKQHQWPLQLAIGHNPLVAKILAKNSHTAAAELPHPISNEAIRDQSQQQLNTLLIEQLELPDAQQLALKRLGIQNYAQLQQLPLTEVASRFDEPMTQWLMQLKGQQHLPLTFFQPPLTFSDNALFIHEVEHINGLLFPLKRQLSTLSAFLFKRQLAIDHIFLKLQHRQHTDEQKKDTTWLIRFARAEFRQSELIQLLRYQLEKKHLCAPVRQMTLSVDQFVAQSPHQSDYWPDTIVTKQEHGQQLLNRLQARLEPQNIQRIDSNDDARPEFAWQATSAEQPYEVTSHLRKHSVNNRPLWLLPQPIPCTTPQQILTGPERISSGWWHQGEQQQRDYYRVVAPLCTTPLHSEQHLWVFHDANKRWFIHGYFS